MNSSSRRAAPRQVPAPEYGAAPSPSHARFIPKEELASFASWIPGPVGDAQARRSHDPGLALSIPGGASVGLTPDAAHVAHSHPALHPSGPSANQESTGPSAAELEALQQAARQAGYHDGYRDGLAALESFKRSFAQQMASQVGELLQTLQSQLDALDEEMAGALIKSATGLARQVVRSEITTRPELIAQVARDAVSALTTAARSVEIRLHPQDLELVRAGLGEAIERRRLSLVGDATISRGGCRLDAELGSVDASIEARWAQALHHLGLVVSDWPLLTPSGPAAGTHPLGDQELES